MRPYGNGRVGVRQSTRDNLIYYGAALALSTFLLVPLLGLLHLDLSVPISYSGDALATAVHVKDVLDHGWLGADPGVGAPWGQHTNDFPSADNLHLGVMLLLGLASHQWAVVLNIYFLMTFPLSALTAAWAFRRLGVGPVLGVVLSSLFAFAPYHFLQGEPHLYLAAYYPVPFAVVVLHRVFTGTPLWDVRATQKRCASRLTGHNARLVAGLALVATGSSYYGIFTLLVGATATVIALARDRDLRRLGGVASAAAVLLAVLVVNMLPNLLYERAHGANPLALSRNGRGTEVYAFKLAQLLLPWSGHRVGALAALRHRYDTQFPLPSERPALGLVAAIGLVLLGVTALAGVSGRQTSRRTDLRPLSGLVALLLLWGMVGGLATFFTLFVTNELRGWNRLVIFVSVVCLAAVGRELQRWGSSPTRRRSVGVAGVVLLLPLGLYDETPPAHPALRAADVATWRSDQAFVHRVESAVPRGGLVFQLPYMFYPESHPVAALLDSDQFRPYLHSTSARWTYGGIRGRALADWPVALSTLPVPRLLGLLGAARVDGISLARRGYSDRGRSLEEQLTTALHEAPVVSDDGDFSFFDTTSYDAALAERHPTAELALVGSRVTAHAVAYPGAFPGRHPRVLLDNPSAHAVLEHIQLSVSVTTADPVTVSWPDGTAQALTPHGPADLSRTLLVPAGRSGVHLSSRGLVGLVRVGIDDPVLDAFVP